MRLKVIEDIDSQKLLASPEINHGDWPFRFIIRIQYADDFGWDAKREFGTYIVSLHVVSPQAARETDAYQGALNSCGWTEQQVKEWGPYAEYQMLLDYGTSANLWEDSGNNLSNLMKECRKKLKESDFLFGFAMDREENAIGTTGWDMVRGDVLAPLRKHSDQPNVQLMQKIQQ